MIISIESSLPTFKSVFFHRGLNVLLAEKPEGASEGQSRNGVGKSSLLEIIHFLMGGKAGPDTIFRLPDLNDHAFIGTFRIKGRNVRVQRSGALAKNVYILEGLDRDGDIPTKLEKKSGLRFLSNTEWTEYLGHAMFALPFPVAGTTFEENFTPSFRSMFSYFARRSPGGMISPIQQAKMQATWDWQANLSYLFGLDWEVPFAIHKLKQKEASLGELKKAANSGTIGDVIGTVAELRPRVALAEKAASNKREQLQRFQVIETYKEMSDRAAEIKRDLQRLSIESISLKETLDRLQRAVETEVPPPVSDVTRLYRAAGVELPGVVLRRFEAVAEFHDSVVSNRRTHLKREIDDNDSRLRQVEAEMAALDEERRGILQQLEGHGALDDFVRMQGELAQLEATAANLKQRFAAAEALEGESTQIALERVNLTRRLQADHHGREDILDDAILMLAEAIAELYDDRQGRLVVEATETGPKFSIQIDGDRSGGISHMEIFCFDITLLRLVAARGIGPGFLFHDSHLFDGVDSRQVASALSFGKRIAEGLGVQYIVTMNSDIFDALPLGDDIVPEEVVLPTKLSDATETGGLFGFAFA